MLSNVVTLIWWHKEDLMVKKCFPSIFGKYDVNVVIITGCATMATYWIGEKYDAE